ncbi:MAG TPA: ABC transporter permease [Terriglobales bacterium]|nr:ABC transporter permease [Terriglobales bacterium]
MNIRTIALATLRGFLRNKVILLFGSLFVCVVLLMMSPLIAYKAMTTAANAEQMHGFVLNEIAGVMALVSGFGSLLAAWAAADSVAGEMRSGTILAVMARPLKRWEFLAGKFLGVLGLMAGYVLAMLGVTLLLAWLGGQSFQFSVWTLLVYPLTRYALWASISLLLVTLVHPIVVMAGVLILMSLIKVFESSSSSMAAWIRLPVHYILPLTNLISEERFTVITKAARHPFPWTGHVTALVYGLNYALVCFLLATLIFRRRGLSRD